MKEKEYPEVVSSSLYPQIVNKLLWKRLNCQPNLYFSDAPSQEY